MLSAAKHDTPEGLLWPVGALQFNHRNLARRLLLVLAELRIHLRPPGVDFVAFLACYGSGGGMKFLVADLDGDFGVGEQVVVPGRVGGRAAFGGEDEQAVAVAHVHHRVGARLAALRAGGREEQQGSAFPYAADLPSVGPKLFNNLAIPVIPLRHSFPLSNIDADPVGISLACEAGEMMVSC